MSDDSERGDGDSNGIDAQGGGDGQVQGEGDGQLQEDVQESLEKGRQRIEEEAEQAVDSFDEGVVDLLSWVLDTETRARIYVYLRQQPNSTSEEIAEGTGLYPSTVREALAELTEEGKVDRRKRESEGAGNNPYEYEAIAPSELVGGVVSDVQQELNTVFNLDSYLGGGEEASEERQPINITVEEEADEAATGDGNGDDAAADDADEAATGDGNGDDAAADDADVAATGDGNGDDAAADDADEE